MYNEINEELQSLTKIESKPLWNQEQGTLQKRKTTTRIPEIEKVVLKRLKVGKKEMKKKKEICKSTEIWFSVSDVYHGRLPPPMEFEEMMNWLMQKDKLRKNV